MGLTAEAVAQQFKVSREDQDEFAYNSHMKALKHKLMVNLINKLFLSQ
jgi:acetyl-CoA acetyltransferase